jgi:YebC/PmpR family DNA-binding regulatory protein
LPLRFKLKHKGKESEVMGKSWKNSAKTEVAAKKGKIFTKLAREIAISTKLAGPDPEMNPRLKMAIAAAKAVSCPKDTIERAIKRGSGQSDSDVIYEEPLYEGYGPHNVGVIVECQTDNRNRTITQVRTAFKKNGGNLGESGSVQWMFDRVGAVEAKKSDVNDIEEEAIEVEAMDVESNEDENSYTFFTDLSDLDNVSKALQARAWEITQSTPYYRPKNITELSEEQKQEVFSFLEAIEDLDDTKQVFATI